jgi:phosphohistidine phosphatase SixA
LRARQTAEGILHAWSAPAPAYEECEELAPGGRSKRLARHLRELKGDAIGLVGHQPDLGEHLAWLIGSKRAQIDLAKAGVAAVHVADEPAKGTGVLLWLVTPDWTRK